MAEQKQMHPLASAIHHQAGADFWQNRAHILQNDLLASLNEIEILKGQIEELQTEVKVEGENDGS